KILGENQVFNSDCRLIHPNVALLAEETAPPKMVQPKDKIVWRQRILCADARDVVAEKECLVGRTPKDASFTNQIAAVGIVEENVIVAQRVIPQFSVRRRYPPQFDEREAKFARD